MTYAFWYLDTFWLWHLSDGQTRDRKKMMLITVEFRFSYLRHLNLIISIDHAEHLFGCMMTGQFWVNYIQSKPMNRFNTFFFWILWTLMYDLFRYEDSLVCIEEGKFTIIPLYVLCNSFFNNPQSFKWIKNYCIVLEHLV